MSDNIVSLTDHRPVGRPSAPSPDGAFICGWEFCIFDTVLGHKPPEMVRLAHYENKGRLMNLADKHGYSVTFAETAPPTKGWVEARFVEKENGAPAQT